MKVLVLWADNDSPNLGVRALASGSEAMIHTVWPNAEIHLTNYGNRPPQLVIGRARTYVKELVLRRAGTLAWLRGYDLIWDTRSGDSFTDIYGLPRHVTMCGVHEMAHRAGTPVIMAPQTIGPFATRTGRWLARRCLRTSKLVLARDPASAAAAQSLGHATGAVVADLVFALPLPEPTATSHDVLLNVSGLLWHENPHVNHRNYRAAIESLIEQLGASGRSVSLLAHVLDSPHSDNDVPVVRSLASSWGLPAVVPNDLDGVRAEIAGSAMVIAARMHACLNALSLSVPTIPMAYSRKFTPLLESLGWRWGVDLRETSNAADAAMGLMRVEAELRVAAAATARRGQEDMHRLSILTKNAVLWPKT